jgi:hypothetical protein
MSDAAGFKRVRALDLFWADLHARGFRLEIAPDGRTVRLAAGRKADLTESDLEKIQMYQGDIFRRLRDEKRRLEPSYGGDPRRDGIRRAYAAAPDTWTQPPGLMACAFCGEATFWTRDGVARHPFAPCTMEA